ncbi:MAG TPA: hypothetical protein VGO52_09430 [Hyphomonadaceae bacterium]|nr:hypothetical protein [Hyphomonadaceae bacterium]
MPASDTVTFECNTGRYLLAGLFVAAFGILILTFLAFASQPLAVVLAAPILVLAGVTLAGSFLRRGPFLIIGPEGLTYMPFSHKPVPWTDLSAVVLVRYEGRRVDFPGRVVYYPQPSSDMINFAVRDLKPYPSGLGRSISRLVARMQGLPPISIQVPYVKGATMEGIAEAIGRHWDGKTENKPFNYPRWGRPGG